jgi:hypothetical protein
MSLLLYLNALWKYWWALMSCAVFTGLGVYAAWQEKSNHWVVGASIVAALILFLVAAFLSWNEEHRLRMVAEAQLADRRPRFLFNLGAMIWQYNRERDATAFFVVGEIVNQGEPSVATHWSATYNIGASSEPMTGFYLHGEYVLTVGSESITFTNNDLLPARTLSRRVERGEHRGGRLLFTVPGNRTAQVESLQFRIDITCHDYLRTPYTASYAPSPAPVDGIQHLPSENVQPVQASVASPGGTLQIPPS